MKSVIIPFIVLIVTSISSEALGHPFTYYNYLSNREVTEYDEIIWFWTPDTFWGPLHSNDFIVIRGRPVFMDSVSTSNGERGHWNGDTTIFRCGIQYGAPQVNFPKTFANLRTRARVRIDDNLGRLMTVIRFRGAQGIFVYQYPLGLPAEDSLIMHIPNMPGQIIYVNGKLEMEGIVSGRITVSTYYDIGLLDDLRYLGSDPRSGLFDEDTVTSMLAVVSGGDIIIRDTPANGRADGLNSEPANWNRHSIVLNGSYIALGSSLTFEHQNDNWEAYQGPTPDERGQVYFVGGLTQERRGYLHRSNHVGTGYGMSWRYDNRLRNSYPAGLAPEDVAEYYGYFDKLVFDGGGYDVSRKTCRVAYVEPGTYLNLNGSGALVVNDSLIIRGTRMSPVRIRSGFDSGDLRTRDSCFVRMENVIFENDLQMEFPNVSMTMENCRFLSTPIVSGTLRIDSCRFESREDQRWSGQVAVNRSTFHNHGVAISGNRSTLSLDHVTIAGGNGYGLEALAGAEAVVSNSIIAFHRRGIRADNRSNVNVRYCDVAENAVENFVDCEPGEGTISADPQLHDLRSGDLSLSVNSPCLDAGDPSSPRDPDGTRADIGAFWLDRGLGNDDAGGDADGDADEGRLFAAPNPFNSSTMIRFELAGFGETGLRIYDLSGRLVADLHPPLTPPASGGGIADHPPASGGGTADMRHSAFRNPHSAFGSVVWDAGGYPAGIYIAQIGSGEEMRSIKLVKID